MIFLPTFDMCGMQAILVRKVPFVPSQFPDAEYNPEVHKGSTVLMGSNIQQVREALIINPYMHVEAVGVNAISALICTCCLCRRVTLLMFALLSTAYEAGISKSQAIIQLHFRHFLLWIAKMSILSC